MDAWRAILPMLGVIYHSFNAEMRNGYLLEFSPVLNAIHSFRMESFFAMAGLLAGSRLGRANYVEGRLRSILIPVATLWIMATLINPDRGFALLTGRTEHLWFLLCLAEISLVAAVAERAGALRFLDRQRAWLPIAIIGAIAIFLSRLALAATRPAVGISVAFTIVQSLYFAPYFLFGIVVARNAALASTLRRSPQVWFIGPMAFAVLLATGGFAGSPFQAPEGGLATESLRIACALGLAVTVVGTSIGFRWAATPAIVWLANAGYTVYLLHFPLIKLGNSLFKNYDLLPRLTLVVLLSACGSLLIYWLITRSPILRTLLNGAPMVTKSKRPISRWFWHGSVVSGGISPRLSTTKGKPTH